MKSNPVTLRETNFEAAVTHFEFSFEIQQGTKVSRTEPPGNGSAAEREFVKLRETGSLLE